jgi:hypothetical protein
MENGWTLLRVIQKASQKYPGEQCGPTRNGTQHPGTESLPPGSPLWGAGVNRMPRGRGMVSEANARGKAPRYADRDTTTWRVEVRVAVEKR